MRCMTPSFRHVDANIQKNFRITERAAVHFRSDLFNMLNITNFRALVVNWSAGNFGQFTQTFSPGQLQFAVKLTF